MDTPQQFKSELKRDDISNDFDRIIDSPNALEIINNLLEGERRRMNTMSMSEFKRYEPLFQYDGMQIVGEAQFKDLATEYFHSISLYDPVTVMDGNNVVMVLPPIFNRFNQIGMAGPAGTDINQAFINACMSDDPMVQQRLNKYADFYKRMIHVVNDERDIIKKKEQAALQADDAMKAVANKQTDVKQSGEVEDISTSNFKDAEIESLSDNKSKPLNEDNDEFEPL